MSNSVPIARDEIELNEWFVVGFSERANDLFAGSVLAHYQLASQELAIVMPNTVPAEACDRIPYQQSASYLGGLPMGRETTVKIVKTGSCDNI